ncbi:MAG: hypothetical protein ACK4VZ_01690 [Paracoccaceae bacterium]
MVLWPTVKPVFLQKPTDSPLEEAMSMRLKFAFTLTAIGTLAFSTPTLAQTRTQLVEAFSGQWFVFEPAFKSGAEPCSVTLTGTEVSSDGRMASSSVNCAGALSSLGSWSVEGGVLRLFDEAENQRAELGGNQRRITGTTLPDMLGLVVERSNGDGNSEALAVAVRKHRCYYIGLTSICAGAQDMAPPTFVAEGDARPLAQLETFGTLMVRAQPRRDAAQIGTIPSATCLLVNQCLIASDGTWCRASFGETSGWVAKTALRRGEWPIVTYKSGCTTVATE